ncbi:hypothetical protein [Xenorhabdus innexi]|uniref:hypothetical protein n=1 Tax=Xenorhabdus innexi TaxID=290109 RepID=UPI001475C51A|nr:hypothetical protein [Xenorhabdus innexi]
MTNSSGTNLSSRKLASGERQEPLSHPSTVLLITTWSGGFWLLNHYSYIGSLKTVDH